MSCHQTSRPSVIAVPPGRSSPRRRTTSVCSIVGVSASASSTAGLSAAGLPRRQPPSAVITSFASASLMRSDSASALNPPKIDRVRRPEPRAGEHRDGELRDHRHVDRDAVAGPDAELLERVGRLRDLAQQVRVGQRPGVARLADPVVGDLVAEAVRDVPVEAVVADVQLPAGEPLGERQVPLERGVERLEPVDALTRQPRPEGLEVRLGLGVEVGGRVGLGRERRGRAGTSASRPGGSRSPATTGSDRRSRGLLLRRSSHSSQPPGRPVRSCPAPGASTPTRRGTARRRTGRAA